MKDCTELEKEQGRKGRTPDVETPQLVRKEHNPTSTMLDRELRINPRTLGPQASTSPALKPTFNSKI